MRKLWIALAALFISQAAVAQSIQVLPGHVLGNSTAAQRPARDESVTLILDQALGSTRGAIIERGASGWAIVSPSATAGTAWISNGAGADPTYGVVGLSGGGCNAVLTASNGGILYSTASACAILAGTATARLPLLSGASTTPQWGAFTLPASVISGGIPFFSSTSVMGSSALLTANAIMLGGGAGVTPATMASLGTTTTLLHGNAAGAPTFGAVVSADLSLTTTTCTNQFITAISAGGVGTCTTDTLASAQHANQGTTTTVLHGNAAGNPAFGAVSLTADITATLGIGNGGTGQTTKAPAFNALAPTPAGTGDSLYYNGTNWVNLPIGSSSNVLTVSGGIPAWVAPAGGGNVSNTGTPVAGQLAQWTNATTVQGFSPIIPPQGRLTLVSSATQPLTPVMTASVTGATTVYYRPYLGNLVPIYDGTRFTLTPFAEVSQTTSDTTKSPAAVTTDSNYDELCWIDTGPTNRCTRSPAWASGTSRGTGAGTAELVNVNGILLNANSITNGPAAQRGTYVGTFHSNGTSTIDWTYAALGAGGAAGSFNVWNMYNRISAMTTVQDSADSYSIAANTVASFNASTGNRINYVMGLAEDSVNVEANAFANSGVSSNVSTGIGYDSTSAFSGTSSANSSTTAAAPVNGKFNTTSLGSHFMQWLGINQGTNSSTLYGDAGIPLYIQSGMTLSGRF